MKIFINLLIGFLVKYMKIRAASSTGSPAQISSVVILEICSGKEQLFNNYVLRSLKDQKLYTGYSDNLKRRFEEHNKGKVMITKHRKPFILIYYEAYLNQQDATSKEKFLKTQWGRNYFKRVLKRYWAASSTGRATPS